MGRLFNQKSQTEKRRALRNSATKAEILLWSMLKGRQMKDLKFRRQFSVGKYVIDFYCPELKLAIEIDGDIHNSEDSIQYDARREKEIESVGIKFIRIKNEEVLNNIENVMVRIDRKIEEIIKK